MDKNLSLVITTKDKYDLTWHLLDSVHHTTRRERVEIILVDNGSTDATPTLGACVDQYVTNTKARNLAASINTGVSCASCDVVVVANNDVVFLTTDWDRYFSELIGARGEQVVMPLLIEGRAPSPLLYDVVLLAQRANAQGSLVQRPVESHLEMACTAFHKRVFEEVGGFREDMALWYHHQHFFVSLKLSRITLCRCYNVVVRHAGNSTIGYGRDREIMQLLRAEYRRFIALLSDVDLGELGLTMPPFGPYDLVPGKTKTTLRSEDIDLGELESVFASVRNSHVPPLSDGRDP